MPLPPKFYFSNSCLFKHIFIRYRLPCISQITHSLETHCSRQWLPCLFDFKNMFKRNIVTKEMKLFNGDFRQNKIFIVWFDIFTIYINIYQESHYLNKRWIEEPWVKSPSIQNCHICDLKNRKSYKKNETGYIPYYSPNCYSTLVIRNWNVT